MSASRVVTQPGGAPQAAAEFTMTAGGRPVAVTIVRRGKADPHGPMLGSIARITLDQAAIGVPVPGDFSLAGRGPLDQAWAAYDQAQLDAMRALLSAVMPEVQARADDQVVPGTWTPDHHDGCGLCAWPPGLVGDTRITVGGEVVDLDITQGPAGRRASPGTRGRRPAAAGPPSRRAPSPDSPPRPGRLKAQETPCTR